MNLAVALQATEDENDMSSRSDDWNRSTVAMRR